VSEIDGVWSTIIHILASASKRLLVVGSSSMQQELTHSWIRHANILRVQQPVAARQYDSDTTARHRDFGINAWQIPHEAAVAWCTAMKQADHQWLQSQVK
jgi:hypothetical protein